MIIRGGENVYPREVEEFLYTHPEVADVQVVGVPDARYGEEVAAFVALREGASADGDALREFCRGRIAHYKIPRYVTLVDGFPMTVTGKVQKFKLRESAVDALRPAGRGRHRDRLSGPLSARARSRAARAARASAWRRRARRCRGCC